MRLDGKVLVTGVGGFVGGRLAAKLAVAGFDVIALARRCEPTLPQHACITKVVADLATLDRLPDGVTDVVHAAATSPWTGITPDMIVRDNVTATHLLLTASREAGVRRFLFLSSLSAFGRIDVAEVDEMTPSIDPDLYGLTKRVGEELLAAGAGTMPALAFRLPGVVGPGARRNWLSRVKTAIRRGEPIEAYNLARPYNNVVHVDDLCAFVAQLLRRRLTGYDMVTLAAAEPIPLEQALERLMQGVGRSIPVHSGGARRPSFTVSIARAVEQYGYAPRGVGSLVHAYGGELDA